MGKRVIYRRELNVGFLISDGNTLAYPFQVGGKRDQIDQLSSAAELGLEPTKDAQGKSDPEQIMRFLQFGDYLRSTPWKSSSDGKAQFNQWESIYSSQEAIFCRNIFEAGLTKFQLTGKDARHPDTLEFVLNLLIDINKTCEVRQISFDHKDSERESNPYLKEIFNQWDDCEYRIAYKKSGAGFLSRIFDSNGGFENVPSIRRSEIERIYCNGIHELFIETRHNTHVISYKK